MLKTYNRNITELKENEVFCYGSNLRGFHGAGAAGYASFNKFGNVWREEKYADKPHGWKGKWNIKGISEGFQEGEIGKSYAIPTVTNPGAKKSIPIWKISEYIEKFYKFAAENPQYVFYVAQGVVGNLNGYSPEEMAMAYVGEIPENVYFYEPFAKILQEKLDKFELDK